MRDGDFIAIAVFMLSCFILRFVDSYKIDHLEKRIEKLEEQVKEYEPLTLILSPCKDAVKENTEDD